MQFLLKKNPSWPRNLCVRRESILCGFVVGKELWELVFQHSLVWRAPGVTPACVVTQADSPNSNTMLRIDPKTNLTTGRSCFCSP